MSWRMSKYVNVIEEDKKGIIYNSKTGKNLFVNEDALEVLHQIMDGSTLDMLKEKYDMNDIQPFLDKLVEKKFLFVDEENEMTEVEVPAMNYNLSEDLISKGGLINNLRLIVTERCNLDCVYCYERASNLYKHKENMNWETAQKAITSFFDMVRLDPTSQPVVRFFGGEPLVNWSIIEQSLKYIEQNYSKFPVSYIINTNGTLVTKEIAETLSKYKVQVALSIDGIGEYHDYARKYVDGRGSFSVIDHNLDILLEAGCKVNLSTVCTDYNYMHLRELVDYVIGKREKYNYSVGIALTHVHMIDIKDLSVDEEYKQVRYIRDAISYGEQNGISIRGGLIDFAFERFMNQAVGSFCAGIGREMSVNPIGEVYPCSGVEKKLGTIDAIEDVFTSDAYLQLIDRKPGKIAACSDCDIECYCAGGCYADALSSQGKEEGIPRNCSLKRVEFQTLVKEYILSRQEA